MKAWSDPTESKILLPRGYKHPQLSLSTNHQHPSSTEEGQETVSIKAAWVPGPLPAGYHSLYQETKIPDTPLKLQLHQKR